MEMNMTNLLWFFAFIFLAGGNGFGGLFGNNRVPMGPPPATQQDVTAALNNQTLQSELNALGISTANNNYETARLIQDQTMANNTKDFNLTAEYDYVADLMKIVECEDPVEKEKKMDAFKWLWLEEKTFFNVFSIEAVFAYLCKLDMLARWDKLDVEQGKETFRQIIENLRGEARVPEEFQAKAPHVRDLMAG